MLQFKQYRIFIVHSEHSQLRAESKIDQAFDAKDYEKVKSLRTESVKQTDDAMWSEEIAKYEREIYRLLEKIHATPVGQIFFKILNPSTEIWIVSMPEKDFWKDGKGCSCAVTFPFNYQVNPLPYEYNRSIGAGDAYILYRPALGDDTLFHELIHAYRFSYKKFEGNHIFTNNEYNTEEFLAMMMENIYLSFLKKPLYADYRTGATATKEEIYNHFIGDTQFARTLKHFLRHEYLAQLMAHSNVGADFNPFRDFQTIYEQTIIVENQSNRRLNPIKDLLGFPN